MDQNKTKPKIKEKLYYARVHPTTTTYQVCDVVVRTVEDTWFVAVDKKDKQAHLFNNKNIGHTVFRKREDALRVVKEAEEKYRKGEDNVIIPDEI